MDASTKEKETENSERNFNFNTDEKEEEIDKTLIFDDQENMDYNRSNSIIAPAPKKKDSLLHLTFFQNIKNATRESKNQVENTMKKQNSKGNFFSHLRMLIEKATTQENEKFENKIYFGYVYPILDLFENGEFNMERLKPIDEFIEIKRPNINMRRFRTLELKEKKALAEEINKTKKKESDERNKRMNILLSKGEEIIYIKITNMYIFENYLINAKFFKDDQINIAKECQENNWSFPPFQYYEKMSPYLNLENTHIQSSKQSTTKINHISHNESINQMRKQSIIKKEIINLNTEISEKTENANVNEINNSFNAEVENYKKKVYDLYNIYGEIIKNDFDKYLNKKPIFEKKGNGHWIDTNSYFHLFDNFIILHNPKFYKYNISIENLWDESENDKFAIKDFRSVFLIKANVENKNINENNNIFNKENYYSLLINFITMVSKEKTIEKEYEENYYFRKMDKVFETNIILDLFEKDENEDFILFEENILLSNSYETKQLNYIEKGKEYLLMLKEGIFPVGFNLNIYSDCPIEALTNEDYLMNFKNFKKEKFEIYYDVIEGKKYYFIAKFILEVI